jgi:AbrB family looped-hinge helix DNA binding protein
MRITSKGQVTIPQDVRERAGLMPGTDVEIAIEGEVVTIRRAKRPGKKSRTAQMIERLRGSGNFGMSTDEVIRMMRGPSADEELGKRRR